MPIDLLILSREAGWLCKMHWQSLWRTTRISNIVNARVP
jgi:hypothetical protein